jgi:hypothetical protein
MPCVPARNHCNAKAQREDAKDGKDLEGGFVLEHEAINRHFPGLPAGFSS